MHCYSVRHGNKWTKNANIWPKNACFGPKIQIFMGVSKSFGTHITENQLGNLFPLFFDRALDQMGHKCRYLSVFGQIGRFWVKILFSGGKEKNFWYSHIRESMRHLFCVENIDRCGSNWPLGTKKCNFDPKIWIFGAKSPVFVLNRDCVNRAYHKYTC